MNIKTIAIDGPAGSGKGTLGRKIAAHYNFAFLDTGALYRAAAYILITAGHSAENEEAAVFAAQTLRDTFHPKDLDLPVLRWDEVGQAASKIAVIPGVRSALLELQRNFAACPPDGFVGAVLDGRDIGTVILPDADIKLFVTASTEVRAKRRLNELQNRGIEATYEAVLADMRERDARDQGRAVAPLKPADDAHIIDTSALDENSVFAQACRLIETA